jgi:hypothetical protein
MSAFQYILNITGTCANPQGSVEIVQHQVEYHHIPFNGMTPTLERELTKQIYRQVRTLLELMIRHLLLIMKFILTLLFHQECVWMLYQHQHTTCGDNNGQITVTASSDNNLIFVFII